VFRRRFLQLAGSVFLATAGLPTPALAKPNTATRIHFPQGVASADPQPDSILLWTRAEPILSNDHNAPGAGAGTGTDTDTDTATDKEPATDTNTPLEIELILQLSEREDFDSVLVEERLVTTVQSDFTLRALVDGLAPGQHYFYRFIASDGGMSRTGRTMTAPAADSTASLNLAFASCQNYEQGHFGAWKRMVTQDMAAAAEQQIDCVLHLGDFIYERYYNGHLKSQAFTRKLPEFPDGQRKGETTWASSLADYRHLYKVYLADPDLQAARARWPFICTWDDHEFSNNGFRDFSHYQHGAPVRDTRRKRDANQAWFEFVPALVPEDTRALRIYRSLKWGQTAELLLTDLRSYRSDPSLPAGISDALGLPLDPVELVEIHDRGSAYQGGNPPATLPFGDGTQPNTAREQPPATMLGSEQKRWFKQQLANSSARWKIWGNSLPALPLRLDLSQVPFQGYSDGILSTDSWAGFPGELDELLRYLGESNISGTVSLSGDHHMQGAGLLFPGLASEPAPDALATAVDFNVTGISSTTHWQNVLSRVDDPDSDFASLVGGEDASGPVVTWNLTLTRGVRAALVYARSGWDNVARWLGPNPANKGLAYVDSHAHGYGIAHFDTQQATIRLVTVASATEPANEQGSVILREASFALPHWEPGQSPSLAGPEISGTPPFPL
jgi:alkaline phosphatase D